MITLDGSFGEGGGQILRTALGLSAVSGRPFQITNIRANRKNPGLMRQHLTAVRAAVEICGGSVQGAAIGARELTFNPGTTQAGKYHFSIGTAGSCTLVLQAILPALLMADGKSEITLEGGTHNPSAPPFDFLQASFLPLINRMGPNISAQLDRYGFFPAGGGKMTITIVPAKSLEPLHIVSLTNLHSFARAICAELPGHIGQRELKVVAESLKIDEADLEQVQLEKSGPGNALTISIRSDQLTETFTGFGRKFLSAEKVARYTVNQVKKYLATGAPVGPCLADQLLIPMALAGSGRFITCQPTRHTLTNIEVIQKFLDIEFSLEDTGSGQWEIRA